MKLLLIKLLFLVFFFNMSLQTKNTFKAHNTIQTSKNMSSDVRFYIFIFIIIID